MSGSGLGRFFRPFLESAPFNNAFQRMDGDATSTQEEPTEDTLYKQSLSTIGGIGIGDGNANIIEAEETKTFSEWKSQYKSTCLQYIATRMFLTDDDDGAFQEQKDFYYAARFGFIPLSVAEMQLSQSQSQSLGCAQNSAETDMSNDLAENHGMGPGSQLETQPGLERNVTSPESQDTKTRGRESFIPSLKNTVHETTSVSELDLSISKFTARLCSVRLVWKLRRSRPQKPFYSSKEQGMTYPESWRMLGPLHQNYKRVLALEIMEEDVDADVRNREISSVVRAAFGTTTVARIRRVRVFFYNHYADVMMKLIEKVEKGMKSTAIRSKEYTRDKMMISLRNIPARCIFPFHRYARVEAHEKVLERDYGRVAEYCICIAGCSNMKIALEEGMPNEPVRFDSEGLEVGVLIKDKKGGNEFIVTQSVVDEFELGVRGDIKRTENSEMKKILKALEAKNDEESGRQNDDAPGRLRGPERLITTTAAGQKRKAQNVHTYMPLSNVADFLLRNANKERKLREISAYCVVLNFSAPRQTKRNWMMNLTVFDDSMPHPVEQVQHEAEKVLSQLKLVIFAEKFEDFPTFHCAGDIFRCHRLLVDEFRGEVQLTAFHWSPMTVCRPSPGALQSYKDLDSVNNSIGPEHPTDSPNDWIHGDKKSQSPLNFERVNTLWRFGQNRMSSHPNVNTKYKLTNADIECIGDQDQNEVKNGDLTVMLCNIFPYPEEKQSLSTPKGLLRVWDGTGVSRSDPLPEDFSISPESVREEPSEKALISISNIIQRITPRNGPVEGTCNSNESDENMDLDAPTCLCGRVVNIIVWEAAHWNLIKGHDNFTIGKFIRIRNASAKSEKITSLHININTSVTPIPDSAFEVKAILTIHHERVRQNHPFNPNCAYLPLILPERITGKRDNNANIAAQFVRIPGAATLTDCLLAPPSTSLRVKFHIIDMTPKLSDEEPHTIEKICIMKKKLTKYQFMLHVCDADQDLSVLVPHYVAEEFLGINSSEVQKELDADEISSKHRSAFQRLQKLLQEQSLEGTISSTFIDGIKCFVLLKIF